MIEDFITAPETESLFRRFINQSPIFAWAKGEQGRYVYLNETYLRAYRDRLQDWQGKTDLDLWSPETANQFRKNDQMVLEQGVVIQEVEETASPDGGQSYLVCKFPFTDAAGRRLVGGIGVDISEQRRLERKLQDSEERFRLAEEAANIGHFDWDLQTGRTVWGDSLHRILAGKLTPSVSMLDRIAYVHPEDRALYLDAFERALSGQTENVRFSYRAIDSANTIRHRICEARVHHCEQAIPVRIIGVLADITDHRAAEDVVRLEQERRRLHSIVQGLDDAVFLFGADGRCSFFNDAAARLFPFDPELPAPSTLEEMLQGFELRNLDGSAVIVDELPLPRALRGETMSRRTLEVRHRKSGRVVIATIRATPLFDEAGKVVAAVVSSRDSTAEHFATVKVEQANTVLQALSGQLLRLQDFERRRIARELHDGSVQRIAAIAMNLILITRAPSVMSDAETRRLIVDTQDLAKQCSRELRTLSYLLHPPDLEEFGLLAALRSWADGFAQRTGIELDVQVEDPGRLSADAETAIFRIAQEALANVHRHSGSSSAQLRLSVTDTQLRLEVADQGCGIPEHVFTRRAPGLGVGLLGMRERARQLGGELYLVSDSTGTLVRALLPRDHTQ